MLRGRATFVRASQNDVISFYPRTDAIVFRNVNLMDLHIITIVEYPSQPATLLVLGDVVHRAKSKRSQEGRAIVPPALGGLREWRKIPRSISNFPFPSLTTASAQQPTSLLQPHLCKSSHGHGHYYSSDYLSDSVLVLRFSYKSRTEASSREAIFGYEQRHFIIILTSVGTSYASSYQ